MQTVIAASLVITRTISAPEILWTLVSLFAAIYVFRLFWRAWANLKFLRKMGWNSIREYAATTSMIVFGALCIVPCMNTLAGVLAMAIPSASLNKVHPITFMITGIFITKSILVACFAYWIDRRQVRLIREIEVKGLNLLPGEPGMDRRDA